MSLSQLCQALLQTTQAAQDAGLNRGTSGNLSVRCDDGLLITPSGMSIDEMRPDDMVFMDFNGHFDRTCKPSSEWRFHLDLLKLRPEFQAVLHAHSTYATTLSCFGRDMPAFHYMVAVAGGSSIRCAPYATFGTQTLSDYAMQALVGRKACLLGNHGMLVAGASLEDVLALAIEVESLCEQYCLAQQIGTPNLLSEEEMAIVLEKFRNYGRASL
ncbi:MAG: class II aldolase/adducin family protein [Sulfuricellaceae bacterium]|nr:class II aldolase/adducin family protein [Sulfuricellaceae bacterium]